MVALTMGPPLWIFGFVVFCLLSVESATDSSNAESRSSIFLALFAPISRRFSWIRSTTSAPTSNQTLSYSTSPKSIIEWPKRRITPKFHTFRRTLPSAVRKCRKLTESQKYSLLERVGGRNQQMMANSPKEASRNFPRLLPDDQPLIPDNIFRDAVDSNSVNDDCGEQCEEIRWKLEELMAEGKSRSAGRFFEPTADGDEETSAEDSAESEEQPKSGCRLEHFVPIGNGTSRGDEEILDFEKLCTSQQGIFMLSDECFPLFLNSVICDRHETTCIFDRYTGVAQGKCQTRKLSFKVLRNRGSKECEEWEYVYVEIPVGCECFLSRSSWLDSVPHERP